LVQDWMHSLHSQVTPEQALKKRPAERRVSSENIPDPLKSVVVGCYECHSLNATNHKDNFEHFDFHINIVVSPPDCQVCHAVEVQQFGDSKKAHALGNLLKRNGIGTMSLGGSAWIFARPPVPPAIAACSLRRRGIRWFHARTISGRGFGCGYSACPTPIRSLRAATRR
jgi:hypothetical protein